MVRAKLNENKRVTCLPRERRRLSFIISEICSGVISAGVYGMPVRIEKFYADTELDWPEGGGPAFAKGYGGQGIQRTHRRRVVGSQGIC